MAEWCGGQVERGGRMGRVGLVVGRGCQVVEHRGRMGAWWPSGWRSGRVAGAVAEWRGDGRLAMVDGRVAGRGGRIVGRGGRMGRGGRVVGRYGPVVRRDCRVMGHGGRVVEHSGRVLHHAGRVV